MKFQWMLVTLAIAAGATANGANADPLIDQAYQAYQAQQWQTVYDLLKSYNQSHAPNLRAETMFAEAACNLSAHQAEGRSLLQVVSSQFPLSPVQAAQLAGLRSACGPSPSQPIPGGMVVAKGAGGVNIKGRPADDARSGVSISKGLPSKMSVEKR